MYKPKFEDLYFDNRREMIRVLDNAGIDDRAYDDIMSLVDGTDYFEAPASTSYHAVYPGGLFKHSLEVVNQLVHWTKLGLISWGRKESPYIIGFLHDYCKVGLYNLMEYSEENEYYKYNHIWKADVFGNHAIESLYEVMLHIPLNREEAFCIRYHMGAYAKDDWSGFDAAIQEFPTVLWTHHADMVASKIEKV